MSQKISDKVKEIEQGSKTKFPTFFNLGITNLPWTFDGNIGHYADFRLLPFSYDVMSWTDIVQWLIQKPSYYEILAVRSALSVYTKLTCTVRYLVDITFSFTGLEAVQNALRYDNIIAKLIREDKINVVPPKGLVIEQGEIKEEKQIVPDLVEKVSALEGEENQIDKSDPVTYTDDKKAVSYVKESLVSRVADLVSILRCVPVKTIVAVNDGAGAGFFSCQFLQRPCHSYDPSDAMIAIGNKLGATVTKKSARDVIANHKGFDAIFLVSHSEELDPGIVDFILEKKYQVVVFESKLGYKGYSRLYENHPFVRSSFQLKFPVLLSRPFRSVEIMKWVSIATESNYQISEAFCVPYLSVVDEMFKKKVNVYPKTTQVYELAKAMNYGILSKPEGIHMFSNVVNGEGIAFWVVEGVFFPLPNSKDNIVVLREGVFLAHPFGKYVMNGRKFSYVSKSKTIMVLMGVDTYYTNISHVMEGGIRCLSTIPFYWEVGISNASSIAWVTAKVAVENAMLIKNRSSYDCFYGDHELYVSCVASHMTNVRIEKVVRDTGEKLPFVITEQEGRVRLFVNSKLKGMGEPMYVRVIATGDLDGKKKTYASKDIAYWPATGTVPEDLFVDHVMLEVRKEPARKRQKVRDGTAAKIS